MSHTTYMINEQKIDFDVKGYLKNALSISRIDMPQLKIEKVISNKEKFIKKGIGVVEMKLPANQVFPTQNEINLPKVMEQIASGNKIDDRVFVVSNELQLMDGHHGHVQQLIENENGKLNFFVFDMDTQNLLKMFKNLKEYLNKYVDVNGSEKINEGYDRFFEDVFLCEDYGTQGGLQGMGSVVPPSVSNSNEMPKMDGSGDVAMVSGTSRFITTDELREIARKYKEEQEKENVVNESLSVTTDPNFGKQWLEWMDNLCAYVNESHVDDHSNIMTKSQLLKHREKFDDEVENNTLEFLESDFSKPIFDAYEKIWESLRNSTEYKSMISDFNKELTNKMFEAYNNSKQKPLAVHFTRDLDEETISKLKTCMNKPVSRQCMKVETEFSCDTMEGVTIGKAGDYLVVGVDGEVYPCDAEIFGDTYLINENPVTKIGKVLC